MVSNILLPWCVRSVLFLSKECICFFCYLLSVGIMLSAVMVICSKSLVYVVLSLVNAFLYVVGLFVVLRVELLVGICGGNNGFISVCFDDLNKEGWCSDHMIP